MKIRLLLGGLGGALIGYGAYQLLHHDGATHPAEVAKWLIAALILHDGIIAWTVVVVGWLVARFVPARARAYVQGGLICAALVTVIALPLIYRGGKADPSLTLLTQDYVAHLAILLGMVAAVAAAAYAMRVLRDRHGQSRANARPSTDQTSPTA